MNSPDRKPGVRLITDPGPIPGQQRLPDFETWPVADADGNRPYKATIEVVVQAPNLQAAQSMFFDLIGDMSERVEVRVSEAPR